MASGSIFDPLYKAVAYSVVHIHDAVWKPIFGEHGGWGWALSIATLTIAVRLLLFPLFKKQIKSQRKLQELQPKFREIKEKYKNDKQRLNEEMMKIQREHGNPLLGGCGPVVLQIPLFLSLFRVMNGFRPRQQHYIAKLSDGTYVNCAKAASKAVENCYSYVPVHGLAKDTVTTIATSKIFGVPLAAAFNSPAAVLEKLTASQGTVRIVAGLLIIIMSGTTFLTQRQIMGRQPVPEDPTQRAQQQMTQRIFLYLAPGMLAFSGLLFPVGVLIYWLTTNLWSVGQQYYVLRAMPPTIMPGQVANPKGPPPKRGAGGTTVALDKPKGPRFGLPGKAAEEPPAAPAPAAPLKQVRVDKPTGQRPKNNRPGGSSSNKKKKRR